MILELKYNPEHETLDLVGRLPAGTKYKVAKIMTHNPDLHCYQGAVDKQVLQLAKNLDANISPDVINAIEKKVRSLALLKERNNLQIFVNTELLQESFESFCSDKRDSVKFLNECNATYILFEQLEFQEDAPANATGTAVAGTGDDSSTVIPKKKKKKPNIIEIDPRKFMLFNLYKEHIEDIDELDIITGVGRDLMSLYELLPEQEIFIENLKTGEQIDIRAMLKDFSLIEKVKPTLGKVRAARKSAFGKNLKLSFTKNFKRADKVRTVSATQGVRG